MENPKPTVDDWNLAREIWDYLFYSNETEQDTRTIAYMIARHRASESCSHTHTVVESRGSMRFVNGDVDDDLTEVLVCTDCCKVVKE